MLSLFKDLDFNKKNIFNLIVLVMITSGIMGFIYEEIFYLFDLGYLVKRGSTYGPWIPVYAFGTLFITLLTYKFKDKPLFVFLLCLLISGIVEFATGFVFHRFFNLRLWDYNVEILNFGNIGGYVCLRSILLFGTAGLFIVKCVIPLYIKLIKKYSGKVLNIICISLICIFFLDMLLHFIFCGF